jgi:hypothetical protein
MRNALGDVRKHGRDNLGYQLSLSERGYAYHPLWRDDQ